MIRFGLIGICLVSTEHCISRAQRPQILNFSIAEDGRFLIQYAADANSYYILHRGGRVTDINTPKDIQFGAAPLGKLRDPDLPAGIAFYRVQQVPVNSPVDIDGDGIDDVYELRSRPLLNPLDATDAALDPDMDGKPTLAEYLAGTNPFPGEFDATPPRIVAVSPSGTVSSPMAGVPVNAVVRVAMSKAVDPGTVTASTVGLRNQTSRGDVAGVRSVDGSGRLITFTPDSLLPVGTRFQVTVTSGIADLAGNRVERTFSGSFTTGFSADGEGPAVALAAPANGAAETPVNAPVTILMSEALDATSVTRGNVELRQGGAAVEGALAVEGGGRRIRFVPRGLLTGSSGCVLTVQGLRDLAGNVMARPAVINFTTGGGADLAGPSVAGSTPAQGAAGVARDAVISLQLSEPVNPVTVTAEAFNLSGESANQRELGVSVELDASGTVLRVRPEALLAANSQYRLGLAIGGESPEIEDLAGNALSGFIELRFTTGAGGGDTTPPAVVAVSPPDGMVNVAVNAPVAARLSKPLNESTANEGTVRLSGGGGPVTGTVSVSEGQVVTLAPAADLLPSTLYTVTLAGVSDAAGNSVVPFTWTFETGSAGSRDTRSPSAAIDPANGAVGVGLNPVITVSFSEPVNPADVTADTLRLSQSGFSGRLPATVALDAGGKVAVLTPGVTLLPRTDYQVASSRIRDIAGNQTSINSAFRTGEGAGDSAPPRVLTISPANGTAGVPANTLVVLTFSEPLDPSTINDNGFALFANGVRRSLGGGDGIRSSADGTVVTLNPGWLAPLEAGSVVTVVVTREVRDLAGNRLTDFASLFTVVTEP